MITEIQAKQLLETLSQVVGDELSLDQDCEIISNENRLITIHYDYDHCEIQLYGVIGQLPNDEDISNNIIRYFMINNFMWKNSYGATFAFDKKNNLIILQQAYQEYEEVAEDFQSNLITFDYELGHWVNTFNNLPMEIDAEEIDS